MEDYVEKKRRENTAYRTLSEHDSLKVNGKDRFSVLDVWRYAYCQLGDDILAEFLVAKALGVEKAENNSYWTSLRGGPQKLAVLRYRQESRVQCDCVFSG